MRKARRLAHPRVAVPAGLLTMAAGSLYLALVLVLRIDGYLFPGNELQVPRVGAFVPGTDIRVEVGLPGISTAGEPPWTPDDRLLVLVLGLDKRPYEPEDGSYRSDSIIVANIDTRSGMISLFHIPRDLWADIPVGREHTQWGKAKINSAYANGEFYDYPGGPAAASVAAIERYFSFEIDQHVIIEWPGFIVLVDTLGGIEITVTETLYDLGVGVLAAFDTRVLEPGTYHMTGEQALGFSRIRNDNDLKRIERQQQVIRAVAERMQSLGLNDEVTGLWDAYRTTFKHDVSAGQIPGFALLASRLDLEHIESFSLNEVVYGSITPSGEAILLAPEEPVYAIVDEWLADPRFRAEAPRVAVAHPPGQEELANELITHLGEYGAPAHYFTAVEWTCSCTPGVYTFNDKPYTEEKLAALTGLLAQGRDAGLPPGYHVVIRIDGEVELVSP